MNRRWPIFATIIALAAIATMIGLGFWQLQRKAEKDALLARFESAHNLPAVTYPAVPMKDDLPLYRPSAVNCIKVTGWRAVSGSNISGKAGYAHLANCQTGGAEGPGAVIALGWTQTHQSPAWKGGVVNGIIAPDKEHLIRLVASDAVDGLQLLAKPSPRNIPNNHLLYAIQWFIFAGAAAIIFMLAMRKKQKAENAI